jgi:hypothetical protein
VNSGLPSIAVRTVARMRNVVGILVLASALAACGGDSSSSTDNSSNTSGSPSLAATASPSAAPEPSVAGDDPAAAAAALAAAIPSIGAVVKITEDNDSNDLIGRPGQYDAAMFIQDKRLGCTSADNYSDLSIDCGAKLERWPSKAAAQARADDIQQKLKDFGLGTEYDYIRDRLLLRVAGKVKPSDAKAYETAFLG